MADFIAAFETRGLQVSPRLLHRYDCFMGKNF